MSLRTPIAFIIFRRPDQTARVWERIREAQPEKLFLIADGGRNEEEWVKCRAARKVVETIDWDCEVHQNFSNANLGARDRVDSGLDWVFEHVEQAIILEDDCLPSSSFFRFCEELLEKYIDDKRIMHIGGDNFQNGARRSSGTYYFSRYAHCWGWATWRRAWLEYSKNELVCREWLQGDKCAEYFTSQIEAKYWTRIFERHCKGEWNAWDFFWMLAVWRCNGQCIVPEVNLVENIGFGMEATHTLTCRSGSPALSIRSILPPDEKDFQNEADFYVYKNHFHGELEFIKSSFYRRAINKLLSLLKLKKIQKKIKETHFWKILRNPSYRHRFYEKAALEKLPKGTSATTDLPGFKLEINCPKSFLAQYQSIFEEECYNFPTTNENPRIIDCGANIGLATIWWKKQFPKARITAFEPDAEIFKILQKNVVAANISEVDLRREAVWVDNSFRDFDAKGGASGGLVFHTDEKHSINRVKTIKLADFIYEPIDILKIDIEGTEFEVLADCESCLHMVKHIFVEYHQKNDRESELDKMLGLLRNQGFRVFLKQHGGLASPFMKRPDWDGFDLMVDIFAFRW
jgi:FkbM family methyltransferase